MYIINTTFIVEGAEQDAWLNIIKSMYIPFIQKAGFNEIVFTRVISTEAVKQFTYSLQVGIKDIEHYNIFTQEVSVEYHAVADPLFGEKIVWFTSLMKKLELE